jgi:hypothetical protein
MGLFSTNLSNTAPSMAGLLSWWNGSVANFAQEVMKGQ